MADKLTPKQRRFVDELLADPKLRQGEAAKKAGFSKKNADAIAVRLMKKPQVKAALEAAMAEREKRTGIQKDYVLETIQDTIERCRALKPVTFFGQPILVETTLGEKAALCKFDSKGVLKGCELLGRHLAMWNDKLTLLDEDRPLEELDDAELMKIAQERDA
jgi:phage terminase small subunit